MKEIKNSDVKAWPDKNYDWSDDFICHIRAFAERENRQEWPDISREAARLYAVAMDFEDEIENCSPLAAFFECASYGGQEISAKNVAKALGISEDDAYDLVQGDLNDGVIESITSNQNAKKGE